MDDLKPCVADEFREWHNRQLKKKYPPEIMWKLSQDREAWMAREGITCCKREK